MASPWDRDQLETFASVVAHQSFERAATAMNLTRGAVSQRIRALEESMAAVLLVRERPVLPTAAGEVLLRHVQALRLLEEATLQRLAPAQTAGRPVPLSVAVSADSLATWFGGALTALLAHPRIALELVIDDQDHTFGRLTRGEVVGCVSTAARPMTGFSAEPLGRMAYRCVAHPAFARRHFGGGLVPAALLSAPALMFDRRDTLQADFFRQLLGFVPELPVCHYVPSPQALLALIAQGFGFGLVPAMQAAPLLQAGTLVDLAPGRGIGVPLYWHRWQAEPELAAQVTALVLAQAARALEPLAPVPGRAAPPPG